MGRSVAAVLLFFLLTRIVCADQWWFPIGEQLVHNIYWGFMPVGHSVTTCRWIDDDGRKFINIRIRTRTNSFFDRIRPVNDLVEAVVNPRTFLPVTFRRKMIRRKQVCDEITIFDYRNLKAVWQEVCSGKSHTFDIDRDTRDMLTLTYYLRRHDIPSDSTNYFRVMADEGMFDLAFTANGTNDVELASYGNVNSIRVDPVFDFDGLLVDGGKFNLWISRDDRRILTEARIKRPLADIHVVLDKVLGPGDDFWIKKLQEQEKSSEPMTDEQVERYLEGESLQSD